MNLSAPTKNKKKINQEIETHKPSLVEQDLLSPLNVIRPGLGKWPLQWRKRVT